MTMTVASLMAPFGEKNYYSEGFMLTLENHLNYLLNPNNHETLLVEGINKVKYQGDFHGLLTIMNIPTEMHWITTRMNGLASPMDYDGSLMTIIVPDRDTVEFYLRRFASAKAFVFNEVGRFSHRTLVWFQI